MLLPEGGLPTPPPAQQDPQQVITAAHEQLDTWVRAIEDRPTDKEQSEYVRQLQQQGWLEVRACKSCVLSSMELWQSCMVHGAAEMYSAAPFSPSPPHVSHSLRERERESVCACGCVCPRARVRESVSVRLLGPPALRDGLILLCPASSVSLP